MATYEFLSDDWLAQTRAIRAEFEGRGATIDHSIRMNLVVNQAPSGNGPIEAHADTSTGSLVLEKGHLDDVDLTVTVDYDVAKAILVEGDFNSAMQAFMQGKIKVEGDISKLLGLQSTTPDPVAAEMAARVQAITA
jgi:hypothetical protein